MEISLALLPPIHGWVHLGYEQLETPPHPMCVGGGGGPRPSERTGFLISVAASDVDGGRATTPVDFANADKTTAASALCPRRRRGLTCPGRDHHKSGLVCRSPGRPYGCSIAEAGIRSRKDFGARACLRGWCERCWVQREGVGQLHPRFMLGKRSSSLKTRGCPHVFQCLLQNPHEVRFYRITWAQFNHAST